MALARTLDDPPPAPRGLGRDGSGNARRRSRYDADRDASDLLDPDDLDDGYDLDDDDLDDDDGGGNSGDHLAPACPDVPQSLVPAHLVAIEVKANLTDAEYYAELNRELALRPAPRPAPCTPPQPGTGPPPD